MLEIWLGAAPFYRDYGAWTAFPSPHGRDYPCRIEAVLAELGSEAWLALASASASAKMLRADLLDDQIQAAMSRFYRAPMASGARLIFHQNARNSAQHGGKRAR